jgi:hypothetical protein
MKKTEKMKNQLRPHLQNSFSAGRNRTLINNVMAFMGFVKDVITDKKTAKSKIAAKAAARILSAY